MGHGIDACALMLTPGSVPLTVHRCEWHFLQTFPSRKINVLFQLLPCSQLLDCSLILFYFIRFYLCKYTHICLGCAKVLTASMFKMFRNMQKVI